jgi:hypothetical protein
VALIPDISTDRETAAEIEGDRKYDLLIGTVEGLLESPEASTTRNPRCLPAWFDTAPPPVLAQR